MRKRLIFLLFGLIFLSQFGGGYLLVLLFALCLLFVVIGSFWFWILIMVFLRIVFWQISGVPNMPAKLSFDAYVCSYVLDSNYYASVFVCGLETHEKLLVRFLPDVDIDFGETYRFYLLCHRIEGEYADYYRSLNVFYTCDLDGLEPLKYQSVWVFFLRKIAVVRNFMYKKIEQGFHYPAADLLTGLLFGYRANFDLLTKYSLNYLGLTHLIAISGYNVALFLLLVDKLLFFVNRFQRMYLYPIFLLIFIVLTGFQSSVIRACLMAQIQLLALKYHSDYQALDALFVVTIVMFMWSPDRIYFDVGFWLSITSTMGIILFGNRVLGFVSRYFKNTLVQEALAMGCVSMGATMLISIVFFAQFNLFAILTNILVAPLVPVLMLGAFNYSLNFNYLLDLFYRLSLGLMVDVFFLLVECCLFVNLIFWKLFHDFFNFMS